MASRPVSKLETESQLVDKVLGQMNAVKANGQVMQGLVNRRSREKDVFQNIKPVFPALSENADLSTAQKFAALNLLLERESSGGVDTGLETIGDTVGRYHIKKSNAETIDPAIANMTDAEYKTYIKNNPDKEEALVASFIDTEINSIMNTKGIDTTKLSPNEYAAVVSNLYTSTDQPKLLENTATLTNFRSKAFPERATTNPSDLQGEPEQFIDQPGPIVNTGEGVDPPEFEDERKAGLKDLPLIGRFFAEGGVPMKKQMEMFEDGGLMDEGGTVDPVSGNDVPPGSTQEEVRDDIPAQLSEGEFVFPADVVRYIGLGNLMSMRQEAKLGLQVMDKMGQMGNSEEATMPDNLPFDINDLDMADEREYNVGGFVPGTPQQQQYGIAGYQQAMVPTTGFMQQQPVQFGQQQPVQAASQQFVQPTYTAAPQQAAVPTMQQYKPEEIPTFTQTIGQDPGQYDELRLYRNDAGAELRIPFKNGQPIYPIPEGYKFVDPEATKTESVTPTTTTGQTGRVLSQDELRDRDDADAARRQEEIERFGNASHKIGLSNFYGEGRDQIFGVNLVEGYASGPQGYFQFMSGKHPEGALIMLKDGDQEYLVTGADYEKIKGDIGKSGTRGNLSPSLSSDYDDTRTILDEGNYRAGQKAAKDFVDSLKKKDKGFLAGLVGGDEDDPSGLTSKQIDLMLKSFAGVTDYGVGGDDGADLTSSIARPSYDSARMRSINEPPSTGIRKVDDDGRIRTSLADRVAAAKTKRPPSYADSGSPEDPPAQRAAEQQRATSDAGRAAAQQASMYQQQDDDPGPAPSPGTGSMEAARSSSTSRDFSAPAPSYSYGSGPRAKGGLIEKPKPKAKKKMKRGGLASKK